MAYRNSSSGISGETFVPDYGASNTHMASEVENHKVSGGIDVSKELDSINNSIMNIGNQGIRLGKALHDFREAERKEQERLDNAITDDAAYAIAQKVKEKSIELSSLQLDNARESYQRMLNFSDDTFEDITMKRGLSEEQRGKVFRKLQSMVIGAHDSVLRNEIAQNQKYITSCNALRCNSLSETIISSPVDFDQLEAARSADNIDVFVNSDYGSKFIELYKSFFVFHEGQGNDSELSDQLAKDDVGKVIAAQANAMKDAGEYRKAWEYVKNFAPDADNFLPKMQPVLYEKTTKDLQKNARLEEYGEAVAPTMNAVRNRYKNDINASTSDAIGWFETDVLGLPYFKENIANDIGKKKEFMSYLGSLSKELRANLETIRSEQTRQLYDDFNKRFVPLEGETKTDVYKRVGSYLQDMRASGKITATQFSKLNSIYDANMKPDPYLHESQNVLMTGNVNSFAKVEQWLDYGKEKLAIIMTPEEEKKWRAVWAKRGNIVGISEFKKKVKTYTGNTTHFPVEAYDLYNQMRMANAFKSEEEERQFFVRTYHIFGLEEMRNVRIRNVSGWDTDRSDDIETIDASTYKKYEIKKQTIALQLGIFYGAIAEGLTFDSRINKDNTDAAYVLWVCNEMRNLINSGRLNSDDNDKTELDARTFIDQHGIDYIRLARFFNGTAMRNGAHVEE